MIRILIVILSAALGVCYGYPYVKDHPWLNEYVVRQQGDYYLIESTAAEPGSDDITIAFLGNSHTFVNSVPITVAKIGKCFNKTIWIRSVLLGGRTLNQHLNDHKANSLLRSRVWDFVVLQPQSVEPIAAPEVFRSALRKLERIAIQQKATPVLYCPWGRSKQDPYKLHERFSWAGKDFFEMTNRLRRSCLREATRSRVAEAGYLWSRLRSKHPSIALHTADGNHATAAGSYLAALSLYKQIDQNADLTKCSYTPSGVDAGEARLLRKEIQ